ncbi:hypothetical protein FEM03_02345 [Phragmitibacter flavus]|uniref:Uncharacterized protein n=1 Tax=Phragmitibacter flavus TaxID=2576071 RepID=A0A5R8KIZ0_9BACT|nr:hypothetical protein [Phragmitibacter flavus]TLD72217.1 hypothetical protein FEM03_02345 [Phragmitibacter flavus]
MIPARKLLFFSLFIFASAASADEKTSLTQRYQPGKTYQLAVESTIETRHLATDEVAHSTAKIKQTYEMQASKEATGQTLVKVHIASIEATITSPEQLLKYDSANPALSPPALQQTFGAMKDKSFTLVYDSSHRLVETRDAANDDTTPLGTQTGMTSKQLAEAFHRLRDLPLPVQPMAPGKSWTWENQLELPPIGKILIKGISTLEPPASPTPQGIASIKITGQIEFPPLIAADSTPITLNNASSTGTLLFDQELGQVKKLETVTSLTVQQQGQTFHLRQTEKTELISVTDTATDTP